MSSQNAPDYTANAVIKCDSVYKVFGENAKKIMKSKKDIIDNYCKSIQALIVEK